MIREFKEFINRGNIVELAVAFVMGLAFSTVITALVNRIINPLIGLIFSTASLDTWLTFGKIDEATGLPAGSVGAFIGALINFVIVAWVMFLVVKAYNRTRPEPEETPEPGPSQEVVLLTEIRDSLRRG
ncbi:MAG: large conductance mechanosensitive channel protein MscL [Acidimicrobiia bacterium]